MMSQHPNFSIRYVQSRAARQLSGDDMRLDSKDVALRSAFGSISECQVIKLMTRLRFDY